MRMKPACMFLLICTLSAAGVKADDRGAVPLSRTPQLRRPVALAIAGERLYAANRRSGTISVLDPRRSAVLDEVQVARELADLAVLDGGRLLAALDSSAHEVILIERRDDELRVVQRLAVAHTPVSIAVSDDGARCFVASLWARQVTSFALNGASRLVAGKTIDLPIAPRKQVFVPADAAGGEPRLVVADSFGGELAIVDPQEARLLWTRRVAGHNIRGLALSHDGRELLLAHQILDEGTGTDYENVFWGGVMINVLRCVELVNLLSAEPPTANVGEIFGTHALGHPGSATGDPGDVLVTRGGRTIVSLSGVGELAVRRRPTAPFDRFDVGRRPTGLAEAAGETVYIANTFEDSVSVLDLQSMQIGDAISLGPQPELSEADRGEVLFYDAALSLNGWYSCHSCHTDGHTNGRLSDNLGDDYFGDPKRIPSLLGTAETRPWAWHGRVGSLDEQVRKSIRVTMQGGVPREEDVQALRAYLDQLSPPPAVAASRGTLESAAVARGRAVFGSQGCAECHRPPAYTTAEVFDVGLRDKRGLRAFNPPSLRGVSQRAPYFHDNRAATLRDVLTEFDHGGAAGLTDGQRKDLLEFLNSL